MAHRMPGLCQWQAKLADLEYAKKYPPPNGRASVDPKIVRLAVYFILTSCD